MTSKNILNDCLNKLKNPNSKYAFSIIFKEEIEIILEDLEKLEKIEDLFNELENESDFIDFIEMIKK